MNTHIAYVMTGLTLLSSCSDEEKHSLASLELSRLEKKLDLLLQREETEEDIFLRNIRELRRYVADHPDYYHTTEDFFSEGAEQQEGANYGNFKSWSKRTLDGFASFFINVPGGN